MVLGLIGSAIMPAFLVFYFAINDSPGAEVLLLGGMIVVSVILSVLSVRAKWANIALIVIGALTATGLIGLFLLIGGILGLSNLSSGKEMTEKGETSAAAGGRSAFFGRNIFLKQGNASPENLNRNEWTYYADILLDPTNVYPIIILVSDGRVYMRQKATIQLEEGLFCMVSGIGPEYPPDMIIPMRCNIEGNRQYMSFVDQNDPVREKLLVIYGQLPDEKERGISPSYSEVSSVAAADAPVQPSGKGGKLASVKGRLKQDDGTENKKPWFVAVTVLYVLLLAVGLVGYFTDFFGAIGTVQLFDFVDLQTVCRVLSLMALAFTPTYFVYFSAHRPPAHREKRLQCVFSRWADAQSAFGRRHRLVYSRSPSFCPCSACWE